MILSQIIERISYNNKYAYFNYQEIYIYIYNIITNSFPIW